MAFLTALKLVIFAILFVISGGIFFAWHFREHKILLFGAAIVATLGSIYLFRDVCDDFELCRKFEFDLFSQSEKNLEPLVIKPEEKPELAEIPEFIKKAEELAKNGDFSGYFQPKREPIRPRDMFETTEAFEARQRKASEDFQARQEQLLQHFNSQVNQGNRAYSVGVLHLKDYDADKALFSVTLEWQADWVKTFFPNFPFKNEGFLKISPKQAKKMYNTSKDKLLFILTKISNKSSNKIDIQAVIVEKGRIFQISSVYLIKLAYNLQGHTGAVLSVAIGPDGQWALSGEL